MYFVLRKKVTNPVQSVKKCLYLNRQLQKIAVVNQKGEDLSG